MSLAFVDAGDAGGITLIPAKFESGPRLRSPRPGIHPYCHRLIAPPNVFSAIKKVDATAAKALFRREQPECDRHGMS